MTAPHEAPIHTILGANGVVGRELARALSARGCRVREVSRTPFAVNTGDEVVAADLLDARATANAVAGSAVAYLVAGLEYRARTWEQQWPLVMRHAIDACEGALDHHGLRTALTACRPRAAVTVAIRLHAQARRATGG